MLTVPDLVESLFLPLIKTIVPTYCTFLVSPMRLDRVAHSLRYVKIELIRLIIRIFNKAIKPILQQATYKIASCANRMLHSGIVLLLAKYCNDLSSQGSPYFGSFIFQFLVGQCIDDSPSSISTVDPKSVRIFIYAIVTVTFGFTHICRIMFFS